jgi:transcriptional regulator with XRE-family HTH domain
MKKDEWDFKAFNVRLEAALKAASMTKHDLSKALGISQAMVPGWGKGRSNPTLTHFVRAAKCLGVNLGWLAFGEECSVEKSLVDPRITRMWVLLKPQEKAVILVTMSTFCGFKAPSLEADDPRLHEILKIAEMT